MERKKIIVVSSEEAKFLEKELHVSHVTVWHALKYLRSNDIHKKIRKMAIERGGQQMVLAPEFETLYLYNREDADEQRRYYMFQVFENGATLEACLDNGLVIVRDNNGAIRGQWNNPEFRKISAIQEVAQSL